MGADMASSRPTRIICVICTICSAPSPCLLIAGEWPRDRTCVSGVATVVALRTGAVDNGGRVLPDPVSTEANEANEENEAATSSPRETFVPFVAFCGKPDIVCSLARFERGVQPGRSDGDSISTWRPPGLGWRVWLDCVFIVDCVSAGEE